jgi:hypothetical protein
LVSAIQISCSARLALVCRLFGSLFRMLAVLCTQQRCSRVVDHTSPSAFQNPSAPSATAICGAVVRPRRFKSSSRSRHDCEENPPAHHEDPFILRVSGHPRPIQLNRDADVLPVISCANTLPSSL